MDWTLRTPVRDKLPRIMCPDLKDFDELTRMQVLRWAAGLAKPPFLYTEDMDWLVRWWDTLPKYLTWVTHMRWDLLAVLRTQADADKIFWLRQAGFPLGRVILVCVPQESLHIPPADIVLVGDKDPRLKTKSPIRLEWVEELRRQAEDMDAVFHFRSRCGWWPEEMGGEVWQRKDGYVRGPRVPLLDEAPSKPYPSWFRDR